MCIPASSAHAGPAAAAALPRVAASLAQVIRPAPRAEAEIGGAGTARPRPGQRAASGARSVQTDCREAARRPLRPWGPTRLPASLIIATDFTFACRGPHTPDRRDALRARRHTGAPQRQADPSIAKGTQRRRTHAGTHADGPPRARRGASGAAAQRRSGASGAARAARRAPLSPPAHRRRGWAAVRSAPPAPLAPRGPGEPAGPGPARAAGQGRVPGRAAPPAHAAPPSRPRRRGPRRPHPRWRPPTRPSTRKRCGRS
jgi:translation initiation factor IF-2